MNLRKEILLNVVGKMSKKKNNENVKYFFINFLILREIGQPARIGRIRFIGGTEFQKDGIWVN